MGVGWLGLKIWSEPWVKNEHVCPVEKAGGLDSGIREIIAASQKDSGKLGLNRG